MKLIEYILRKVTVAETSDLANNTAVVLQESNIDDDYLNEQTELLTLKGNEMKVSLAADRSKEKTEELSLLDAQRDACFRTLKKVSRGYMDWEYNNHHEYAAHIYNLIKKHGLRLDIAPQEEESALLESLLIDLELPEGKKALNGIHLTEVATDLRAKQTAYKAVYLESAQIEAGKAPIVSATNLKREVITVLNKLVDYLNAMNNARPAVYRTLATQVAELVNNLNQKVRTRKNHN